MALQLGVNSYVIVADADIYFSDSLNVDVWLLTDPAEKSKSLVTASRQISLYVKEDCKLPFTPPLTNANLAAATQELALAFLTDAKLIVAGNVGKNVKRAKAGSAEVEFFSPNDGNSSATRFPPNVMKLLIEAGCIDGSNLTGVIATGTDAESGFCDPNPFGRTVGYY